MLFMTLLIVVLTNSIQCSKVLDVGTQKGIHISDYCPKMKYCPEGSHVMCMYYDENNVMGPKCRDPKNVSITPVLANKLLDVTNALRSKISRGQEKGKNGERLPRGYGIFRLKWDNELATFAQVLANQCLLRHDFCRATKKFPDPGQTASLVRFSRKWVPVSHAGNFTHEGLNEEKLIYAVTTSLKTWYGQKTHVDVQMVTNYPDWRKNPNNQDGRLYLNMIYGSATHMGCGISAFTEYVFYQKLASIIHNTVLVICNFSAQPRPSTGVYNTVPPTDTESSFNACGCPIGTMEDDDCLCLEVSEHPEPAMTLSQKTKTCPSSTNCDPTVVLLPIFTVEDAPPEKLALPDRFMNASIRQTIPETENFIDSFEELIGNNHSGDKVTLRKSRKTLDLLPHSNSNGKIQRSALQTLQHSNGVTVGNGHFDSQNGVVEHKDLNQNDNKKTLEQLQGQMHRSSVFTNSPVFELPVSHYFLSSIKKDVEPRKDFSTGKQLVNKYLYSKNSMIRPKVRHRFEQSKENTVNGLPEIKSVETVHLTNDHQQPKEHKENVEHHEELHFHDILTTERILNTAEQSILNRKNSDELNSQEAVKLERNTGSENNDNKFMALLDTLEQQVKHIELRDKEKQIFDAKIKKIYDKIVGKPSSTLIAKSGKSHIEHQKISESYDKGQKTEDDDIIVHKLPPSFDAKYDDSNFIEELNYQSKHNSETEIDEKYPKTYITDIEPDEFERSKQKPHANYDIREKFSRQNRKFRQRNRNYLSSLESLRHRNDNGFNPRKIYKNPIRSDFEKLRHRSNSLDYKRNKNYYSNDGYDDILSTERRKYYQDKLDNMEKKLQDARRYNRRKDPGRSPHMRAMKPSIRSDNQINPLYTGRARILHGY